MSTTNLYRDGKVILKVLDEEDGTVTMYKPFHMKPMHIMDMTGAPGWDKRYIDQIFTEGVKGQLTWSFENIKYRLDIASFREHAFDKNNPVYGAQYHCHRRFWEANQMAIPMVSPLRADAEPYVPAPPEKITMEFGRIVPCSACKLTGRSAQKKSEPCPTCQGRGFLPWS